MNTIEKFLEVKVLESTTDEQIELVPANTWCDPVPKILLEDLKKTLRDCKIPHILARVDYETLDSYRVGYVAFIANRYNKKALPIGDRNMGGFGMHLNIKGDLFQ